MRSLTALINLTAACCMLTACGSNGVSPDSPEQQDITPAVPSGLTLVSRSESSLTFRWDAAKDAESYICRVMKGITNLGDTPVKGTEYTAEGLEPGTAYNIGIKSVRGSKASGFCSYVEFKTSDKTPEPIPDPTPIGPAEKIYEAMMIPAGEEDGIARAFPGAEGGGMYTTGGRGGSIYHVTSLEDKNEKGTLRYGISNAPRPCTIVFDVAGRIRLTSPLKISKGDLTIAGQTAPGDGICISDRYVQVDADNVIIRFIRFRLGDQGSGAGDSDDAIWGRYRRNIIIDHCSMSWSIDECASFYSNTNMTLQWCMIAESMRNCSIHTKGNHGYGGIWGGENVSFHHNALAHHDSRNPRFDHPHIYQNHKTPAQRGVVDFRNNVVYDWGSNSSYGGEGYGAGKGTGINMVGNYYKAGPSSTDRKYFLDAYSNYKCSDCGGTTVSEGYPLVFLEGNVHSKYSTLANGADGIYWHDKEGHVNYGKTATSAFPVKGPDAKTCYTTTHSADNALKAICDYAGASIRKDNVDTRTASDIKNGTGKLINDIADVQSSYGKAWADYSATESEITIATTDSDADGIPDYYEILFGLDKNNGSDAAAFSIDKSGRYSNFELYLHYLAREVMAGGNKGGTYKTLN